MTKRNAILCVFAILTVFSYAREYGDSAIYQGINIKLDLGNTVYELARSKAKIQSYEVAVNVMLKRRFLPTLELGFATAQTSAAGGKHIGTGGFGRVGLDISTLKKAGTESLLLVGVRLGTAVQGYELQDVRIWDTYWQTNTLKSYPTSVKADVWGEVVAGLQVKIYKGFHMGWFFRFKAMFTRQTNDKPVPYYIPGYGYRQDTNFGFNYYIGYKF